MLRAYATCIAALFGLAFGSFLNVCASRLPAGESIVSPASHCRNCGRPLRWFENIPLASWLVLRGRCRTCRTFIGSRYPLAELAVAFTWAVIAWQAIPALVAPAASTAVIFDVCLHGVEKMILCWLLILLAVLDAEFLWLPNRLTLGGAILGLPFVLVRLGAASVWPLTLASGIETHSSQLLHWLLGIIIAPGIILFTRWSYRLVRHREGVGLGDAKLMLLLAVWLGLAHTLLAFFLGIMLGTVFALVLLAAPRARRGAASWALTKMPLGTFLCVGGIFSALWGNPMIAAYLHAVGF